MTRSIRRDALFASLPPEWPESLQPAIRVRVEHGSKVIVLDDDPTGTQTVHDVPVLTHWATDALAAELCQPGTVAYILTNSRSLTAEAARALNLEVAANLRAACALTCRQVAVVSRSDSTLRGHFAVETRALCASLGPMDGVLVVPFFLEGGRFTVDDIHYVDEDGWLVPAAETEFARDPVFGYAESDLRAWVAARLGAGCTPEDVASISLSDLRLGGPGCVAQTLQQLQDGQPCIVNAVSYRDLEVLVMGLLACEERGQRFLYRTASSFVRVRGGLDPAPLLSSCDFGGQPSGLVVVGSYVSRTTAQLEAAMQLPGVTPIELAVEDVLGASREAAVLHARQQAEVAMGSGRVALVYTSRQLITVSGGAGALAIGRRVSGALVDLVAGLQVRPGWIIAKGGITCSDIATEALGIRRAWVRGQAIPGVPVWRTGPETRWPDLDYVVFPGNVGGPGALAQMIALLRGPLS